MSVSVEVVREDADNIRVSAPSPAEFPSTASQPSGEVNFHLGRLTPEGGLFGCLSCDHPELFTQRDFNRTLGIIIVVVAAVLAPFTWYLSLGVAALIDAVLYRFAPTMVVCYVCNSRHRGFADDPRHPSFDREIEERLKYGNRAVMGKPMREGGTADAPEPEH